MPVFGPIKRRALLEGLRRLGFAGPYSGGKHQFVVKGTLRVRVPNPHGPDIGKPLLRKILREAGIDREEWEKL